MASAGKYLCERLRGFKMVKAGMGQHFVMTNHVTLTMPEHVSVVQLSDFHLLHSKGTSQLKLNG